MPQPQSDSMWERLKGTLFGKSALDKAASQGATPVAPPGPPAPQEDDYMRKQIKANREAEEAARIAKEKRDKEKALKVLAQ